MGATAPAAKKEVSHNLVGQRLGKKGRDTRDRIIAATERLLAEPGDTPLSLSAVAREASLGMTTLYLYFSDLTELLLVVLEPLMASAEQGYVEILRKRWDDETLAEHCNRFVVEYYGFWKRHSRILHLRNSLADAYDERMREHRIRVTFPVTRLLIFQMDADPNAPRTQAATMATVLLTGLERMVTIMTDVHFATLGVQDAEAHIRNLLGSEAKLLEFGIRDCRAAARAD
ncbi:TetR/AcrR family transcriptional regulator [Stakelama tenebrarum]|uniref:TetR/AcrR family transcriptional regulator n=1 Tax=Stakelama tenebrarum TaxID=2711215 RepID=A0A6G6Y843_9SPHN|nr:TetR/AcrR family transcriptional regulator [Sphingosinithalassobacter tenebrarum]QIG80743.1 TetR/AcrR family transcriptional regulator [Sphingosinithalassobacter tenebrarum]